MNRAKYAKLFAPNPDKRNSTFLQDKLEQGHPYIVHNTKLLPSNGLIQRTYKRSKIEIVEL